MDVTLLWDSGTLYKYKVDTEIMLMIMKAVLILSMCSTISKIGTKGPCREVHSGGILELPVVSYSVRLGEWIRRGPQCLLRILPFSGDTTKGSLWPTVPPALYNKDPSLVQALLFRDTQSQASVGIYVYVIIYCFPVGGLGASGSLFYLVLLYCCLLLAND